MDDGQWTMDDGRWTMDDGQRLCRAFRANPNIADPTDLLDPSEKPIGQITNPRAIPSVKAATLQNFPSFPCFPWTKNGLWTLAHAKSFRVFSLLKMGL